MLTPVFSCVWGHVYYPETVDDFRDEFKAHTACCKLQVRPVTLWNSFFRSDLKLTLDDFLNSFRYEFG